MRIKITADSTCDLSPELIRDLEVEIVPLYVIEDDASYRDGVGYSPDNIFRHFEKTGRLCKTAAVNVSDYAEIFDRLSKEYDAVIHLNISLDFSSCYQNACLAAQELSLIHISPEAMKLTFSCWFYLL